MTLTHQPEARLARIYRLRLERSFDEAERLFREKIERTPNEASLRSLARLLVELHRPHEAQPFWSDLVRMKSNDFEASYHLAAWKVENGVAPNEAVAQVAPATSETFRSRLIRVITEPVAEQDPNMNLRHLAICGASYCGSTLLDRIIGSLPGVASIGESHWLTKMRDGPTTEIDFSLESPRFIPQCSVCGDSCRVLTFDFRMDLAANRRAWYQKIGQRLGTKVLNSADKNWPKLIEKDPLLRMDALVLFKSPAQAWSSQRSKMTPGDAGAYEEHLEKYIRTWCDNYSAFLNSFKPTGSLTFFCFDDFAASRGRLLGPLCKALHLPYESGILKHIKRGHAIGGNSATVRRLRAGDYTLDVLPLPEVDLPPREREMLDESVEMQELFATMRRCHQQVLVH